MRVVERANELVEALAGARREAEAAFGDGAVFVERYVPHARHVEIQVLADAHGAVVSLHERECSIQRRHQKIIEESPSPAVDADLRRRLGEAAIAAARAVALRRAGHGRVPARPAGALLVPRDEHPAAGRAPGHRARHRARPRRAAAGSWPRARTCPTRSTRRRCGATPSRPGSPPRTRPPPTGRRAASSRPFDVGAAGGVRVDTGVRAGSVVPPFYDSMVAKVIAHGPTREDAIRTLTAALASARLHGPTTNRDQLVNILRHPTFRAGELHTGFLDEHPCTEALAGDVRLAAAAAALADQADHRATAAVWRGPPVGVAQQPGRAPAGRPRPRRARPGRHLPVGSGPVRGRRRRGGGGDRGRGRARPGRARRRRRAAPLRRGPSTARRATWTPTTGTSRSPPCPASPSRTPRTPPARWSPRCRGRCCGCSSSPATPSRPARRWSSSRR